MNVHTLGPDLFGNHGPLAQAGDAVMTPDWCGWSAAPAGP